jgi:hypothetical protein
MKQIRLIKGKNLEDLQSKTNKEIFDLEAKGFRILNIHADVRNLVCTVLGDK